jgi:hypothetical protein
MSDFLKVENPYIETLFDEFYAVKEKQNSIQYKYEGNNQERFVFLIDNVLKDSEMILLNNIIQSGLKLKIEDQEVRLQSYKGKVFTHYLVNSDVSILSAIIFKAIRTPDSVRRLQVNLWFKSPVLMTILPPSQRINYWPVILRNLVPHNKFII